MGGVGGASSGSAPGAEGAAARARGADPDRRPGEARRPRPHLRLPRQHPGPRHGREERLCRSRGDQFERACQGGGHASRPPSPARSRDGVYPAEPAEPPLRVSQEIRAGGYGGPDQAHAAQGRFLRGRVGPLLPEGLDVLSRDRFRQHGARGQRRHRTAVRFVPARTLGPADQREGRQEPRGVPAAEPGHRAAAGRGRVSHGGPESAVHRGEGARWRAGEAPGQGRLGDRRAREDGGDPGDGLAARLRSEPVPDGAARPDPEPPDWLCL